MHEVQLRLPCRVVAVLQHVADDADDLGLRAGIPLVLPAETDADRARTGEELADELLDDLDYPLE